MAWEVMWDLVLDRRQRGMRQEVVVLMILIPGSELRIGYEPYRVVQLQE